MKLTATYVWRTRAWPGPGSPTSTVSSSSTSGPPVWWKRMARAMFVLLGRAIGAGLLVQCCGAEPRDQRFRLGPLTITGRRIEMADRAEVDDLAAPVAGE